MPAAAPLCRQQRAAPPWGCATTPLCAPGSAAAPTAGRAEERRKGRTPRELHPGDGQRKIPNATRGAAPPSPGGSTAAPSSAEVAAPSASTRDTRRAEPRSKAHSSNAQRSAPRLSVRPSVCLSVRSASIAETDPPEHRTRRSRLQTQLRINTKSPLWHSAARSPNPAATGKAHRSEPHPQRLSCGHGGAGGAESRGQSGTADPAGRDAEGAERSPAVTATGAERSGALRAPRGRNGDP